MKILVFNQRDIKNPASGGAEENIHELSRRWVRMGHEVTLFCAAFPGSRPHETIEGVTVVRGGGRLSVYVMAHLRYVFELGRRRYDVVIDDVNGIPFFTPLFCQRPIIVLVHQRIGDIFFKEVALPLAIAGYLIERSAFPFLYRKKQVVAVSRSTKDALIGMGLRGRRIAIVHNGIEHDKFGPDPDTRSKHPTICYLGRIKRYKRLDKLLLQMPEVLRKFPNAELVIAGTGDGMDEVRGYIKKLGISKHVRLLGHVSEDKRQEVLRSAWVMVNPSIREGWGITTIEANACATPVLAFDVPGLRDSIRDGITGLLAKDEKEMSKNLLRVLRDDKLRQRLSRGALAWSKEFDWDLSAKEFERIMRKVVKRKG